MSIFSNAFAVLQKIGKSLMLPVSVLPVAGILLGVGAADFSWMPTTLSHIMEASGGAIFGIMPLIFAIGVALGFTENDGVSALAASIGYFVLLSTMSIIAGDMGFETKSILGIETVETGVFGGILIGGIAAALFNKYYRIQLPAYLGFFAGKRFVPIVTAFAAILLGVALTFLWPPIGNAIGAFSDWAAYQNPAMAFGIYGFVERSLIPFGLHHIWNVPFFYEAGSYTLENGTVINGEIQRFLQGDPTAGNMAGGYLFKMWGLPAAAIAIWHTAKPENRALVGGIMVSAALTSFLTGITEPIEFAFMFVAPILYVFHALLAGAAFVLTILLDMKHGMTFSHGLIDFGLFFHLSTNGWMFFIVGPLYAALYYFVFRTAIVKFNLKTPGREDESQQTQVAGSEDEQAAALIVAFGGSENIASLDACITRLRIGVNNAAMVDQDQLKAMGASGVVVVGNGIQAIFGTRSENLKTDMELFLKSGKSVASVAPAKATPQTEAPVQQAATVSAADEQLAAAVVNLVGVENIASAKLCAASRVRVEFKQALELNREQLLAAGVNDIMVINDKLIHLIIGENAEPVATALTAKL